MHFGPCPTFFGGWLQEQFSESSASCNKKELYDYTTSETARLAGIPVLWCGDRCWSGWKLSMPRPTGLHQQQENNGLNNYTACNLAEVFFYIILSLLRYTLHLKCNSGKPFLLNEGPRGAVKRVTHCLNTVLPISINQWEPDSYDQARFRYRDKKYPRQSGPLEVTVSSDFIRAVFVSGCLNLSHSFFHWRFISVKIWAMKSISFWTVFLIPCVKNKLDYCPYKQNLVIAKRTRLFFFAHSRSQI